MSAPQEPSLSLAFDPRLGTVVGRRWRVEERLGRGGIGIVYRAVDILRGGEAVALKILREKWLGDPELPERFRREAAALARLSNPRIVHLVDVGEEGGVPYMVMELVRGRTLAAELEAQGALEPLRAVRIVEQVLEAVESAHGAGVVHRDLKPDNIMLADDPRALDRVLVLDFGIALLDDPRSPRLTAAGELRGTPVYMSPEQCRGADIGPPSDVYSVGVMLYELLAGDAPFESDTAVGLMRQHAHAEPPPIAARGIGRPAPPSLERLVMWALRKRPSERPTARKLRDSLGEAARALEAALDEAVEGGVLRMDELGDLGQEASAPPPESEPPPQRHGLLHRLWHRIRHE